MITRITHAGDFVLRDFASVLTFDITKRPDLLRPLDSRLLQRIQLLVGDIEVDLDLALPTEEG